MTGHTIPSLRLFPGSGTLWIYPTLGTLALLAVGGIAKLIETALRRRREQVRWKRTRAMLRAMPDHMLRDIGVARHEIADLGPNHPIRRREP